MFKLVIEDDEGNKTVVPVIRDEISVGRQDGNTIRLTERNVSRKHARIVRENGAVFLEEVEARYGTRKNGEKVDGRTEFGVGDVFSIGDYRLTLQSDVAPEAKKKPPKKPNGAPPPRPPRSEFADQPTQITKLEESTSPTEGTEVLPADPARFVIVSSNFAGQEFPLARKEMVIGRGEECDIIIDHRSVSQKHAKVVREAGGEYKIVDLKSKNGVKVGGEEYRAVHLKRGDIVELGHVKFRFVEAGENYVFTPQTFDDEIPPKGANKGLLVGALLGAILVAIIAGVVLIPSSNEGKTENTSDGTTVALGTNTEAVDAAPEDEDSSVAEAIAKAREEYEKGLAREATARLDIAREMKELTPEQVAEIDDLLSKARREKALQGYFETGRDHYHQERWVEALRAFSRIPDEPPSRVYAILQEEGFQDRAAAEVLAAAKAHVEDDEVEEAKELATAIAQYYDPSHAEAQAILELSDRPTTVAVAPTKRTPRPPKKAPQAPVEPVKKPSPPPEPKQDPARAEALQKQAMDHFMARKFNAAISSCKSALSAGSAPRCNRILGTSYMNIGDDGNACKWFGRSPDGPPPSLACD